MKVLLRSNSSFMCPSTCTHTHEVISIRFYNCIICEWLICTCIYLIVLPCMLPTCSYALAVTLSRLLSFSRPQAPPNLMVECLSSLKAFLAAVEREKMTSALEEYQCNWITVAPFVDIFFAPIHSRTNEQESPPSQEIDMQALCMQTNLMSLSVEMNRPCHRILALKQGLLDTLICLPWAVEVKWRHEVCAIVELFRKDNESLHLPVPKLHTLAAVCLARDNLLSIRDTFNFS